MVCPGPRRLLGPGSAPVPSAIGWRTDDIEPFASFRVAVEAAEGACEARLAAVVFKAALEDPNQARWLLERRFPSSWGRRSAEPERIPEAAPKVDTPAEVPFWLRSQA